MYPNAVLPALWLLRIVIILFTCLPHSTTNSVSQVLASEQWAAQTYARNETREGCPQPYNHVKVTLAGGLSVRPPTLCQGHQGMPHLPLSPRTQNHESVKIWPLSSISPVNNTLRGWEMTTA
jgi:hypothetical protein